MIQKAKIMIQLEYLIYKLTKLFRRNFIIKKLKLGFSTYVFIDYFKDFEKLEVVKKIFGTKTKKILSNLKIDLTCFRGYMYVDEDNGHLVVSSRYLKKGKRIDIYLDLIHELYHIKQFLDGKQLFDYHYDYVDRPTEIEAYAYTIGEARRLGLSEKRILEYLKTEWISSNDLKRLARNLNIKY